MPSSQSYKHTVRRLRMEPLEDRTVLSAVISGTVFDDADHDGVLDVGESPLSGWSVELNKGGGTGDVLETFSAPVNSTGGRGAIAADAESFVVGDPTQEPSGVAYLHRLDSAAGTWKPAVSLDPGVPCEHFGKSVAVADGKVAVASDEAVHLFDADTGQFLIAFPNPEPQINDSFGYCVTFVGDNVLVGAPTADTSIYNAGAAHLFDGGSGQRLHTFHMPVPQDSANFGHDVAVLGNDILVGSVHGHPGNNDEGAAFLFNGSTYSLVRVFQDTLPDGSYDVWEMQSVGGNVLIGTHTGNLEPGKYSCFTDLFDGSTGELLHRFPVGSSRISHPLATPGGNILIGDDDTQTAYLYDGVTYEQLNAFPYPPNGLDIAGGRSFAAMGNDFLLNSFTDGFVYLLDACTTVDTITDGDGRYTFNVSDSGTYHVGQVLQGGYIQTLPRGNDGTYRVAVTDDDVANSRTFDGRSFGNFSGFNNSPVANDDLSYSTPEDAPLTVPSAAGVLANDADADGDPITALLVRDAAHGTLTLNPDGSFTYESHPGFVGIDTFTYTADDGVAESNVATVSVEVTEVYRRTTFQSSNVPLSIRDNRTITSALTVPVGESYAILDLNVRLDVTHAYNADLDAFLIAPNGARIELFTDVGGNSAGFPGTVLDDEAELPITWGYGAFDGVFRPEGNLSAVDDLYAAGTWKLEIHDDKKSDRGQLNGWSITVAHSDLPGPVNSPPEAVDDDDQTPVDTAVVIDVLANDTDADGDSLSVTAVTTPGNGSAEINPDNTITYTPNAEFSGEDSFTYTISDGNEGTDTAAVTVNVVAVQPVVYSIDDVTKREGRAGKTTTFDFTVTRSGGTLDATTIYYATALDGSGLHPAEPGDFVSIPASPSLPAAPLTFGDQATVATISVSVNGDLVAEYDETFLVNLFADPSGAIVLDTAIGTILNDDKGTPIDESANAADAVFAAWADADLSKKTEDSPLTTRAVDDLALMMMEQRGPG